MENKELIELETIELLESIDTLEKENQNLINQILEKKEVLEELLTIAAE